MGERELFSTSGKLPKPIRVFWSPLTRRFYATRIWREVSPGVVECVGERFDVTNDIVKIIEREGEFRGDEGDTMSEDHIDIRNQLKELTLRLVFVEGFARGADLRMMALEKRVYKLEDVVREILQRGAGVGHLVQAPDRKTDGEPVSPDRDAQGGTVEAGDGVPLPSSGGEAVK